MSFRGGARGGFASAPKGYKAGIGRGAAGFTTRSDIGPAAPSLGSAGDEDGVSGSRASEVRAAKLRASAASGSGGEGVGVGGPPGAGGGAFGQAPQGYVAGRGRGMGGGTGTGQEGPTGGGGGGGGEYDAFGGYSEKLFQETPYDEDDEEADKIYEAIDERMSGRNTSKRKQEQEEEFDTARAKIGSQFRELKEKLADVTEDEWLNIPDVGDYSLKHKQQRREDTFVPITDSLLESRTMANVDATASGNTAVAATTAATDGMQTVVANMSGLAAARGTVLGMSLDKMSDSVAGQTNVDPKGYLTSLSNTALTSNADVGDINKARLLLKSVRDTNPKHGPGWIASARVEEAAGKIMQARKIIQEGCEVCPTNEDVWLEAARLHPPEVGKRILATAVRKNPNSVKIFLRAADLETNDKAKKAVLRKAIEVNPTSVTLWKAAIELEEAEDARILLSVAVEKVPHSVEMWLALARLETYENARKVLNQARRALPGERAVWIAAAKLEESQNHDYMVDKIIEKAVKSLLKRDAVVSRDQWLQEAEAAEHAEAPQTASALARHTVGLGVDPEDRQRTWADDARGALARNAVATARAILGNALAAFPHKKSLWHQAVELERKRGSAASLDEVLAAACERLPRAEVFWLLRAKERWLANEVDKAREILTEAFAANPDSESVWLAAAKLEWETGEAERARVLLQRARERASTDRVYMKSALLERENKCFKEALALIEEGIKNYPEFPKLYMMGGQIHSEDLEKNKTSLDRARKFYERGIQKCPTCVTLWILASRLEEKASAYVATSTAKAGVTKARSLLELARLKNARNPQLWVEAIRLERRAGHDKLAITLMARALQECPSSGLLLAENITTSPRVEQKSKSADAIKKCPDDPLVIAAVASLFASERKNEKARKWFDRAVVLDSDLGDSWAKYYAFELGVGSKEQQSKVKERCIAAEPSHGELWCSIVKEMANRRKSVGDNLELVAQHILQQKQGTILN